MPRIRVAACQINTVVGDLAGNVDRIARRPWPGPNGPAPTSPSSPSWRSPATRPRTCSAGRLRGRQPGGVRRGGGRAPGLRRRGRLRRRRTRRAAGQRRRAVPGRRGPGPLREADAAQLRGLRRAALVRPRATARPRSTRWPGCRSASPSARTCGSPAARWPTRPPPAPGCWSTPTPRPTRGDAARSAWRCWPRGPPRRAAPSSTSTRWAARTSWSSTAPRSWSDADGGLLASARQFVEEVLVCDLEVPDAAGSDRTAAGWPCRRPAGPPAGLRSDRWRRCSIPWPRSTRRWCWAPATTWARTASPTRSSACPAGSTRRWWRRSRSTPSGPAHVHGVAMPSRYSSEGSVSDAESLAAALGIDLARGPDRAGPPGPGRHAGPAAGRRADRPDRREPAEPDPGGAPDGPVQRQRLDRAHHGEQERDGHGLLHAVRRLGRRVRRHQGRGQDPRLRALPVPQRPGGDGSSSPSRC